MKNWEIQILKKIKNKKIAMCHGVFDFVHPGHIYHFEQAKKISDFLVVSVTADKFVNKGPSRPFYSLNDRIKHLESLKFIDLVIPSNYETAVNNIRLVKPNFYVKDQEYEADSNKKDKNIYKEIREVKKFNGKIFFTRNKKYSSSRILNEKIYNEEFLKFIKKDSFFFQNYLDQCKKIKDKKILIIGETIFDEYIYVSPLNKSNKENLVANNVIKEDLFYGGALIISKIAAEFSKNVTLITGIQNNHFKKISNIKNFSIKNFIKSNFNNIKKTRYIDKNNLNKIFLKYQDTESSALYEYKKIENFIEKNLSKFDILIVSDFGHNLLNKKIINLIEKNKIYKSTNCQSNSFNLGFNLITKYKKLNNISIDLFEAKLATHIKEDNFNAILKTIRKRIKFDTIYITLGKYGAINYFNNKLIRIPSLFKDRALDTMGAGDIFHLISSLMSYKNNNTKDVLIIASIAAGLKVKTLGHSVEKYKSEIIQVLKTLSK